MEGEDNSPPPLIVPKRIFAVSSEPVGIRVTPYHKPHAIRQILNSLYAEEVDTIRALPFGKLVEIGEMPSFSGLFGRFIIFRQLKVNKKHEERFILAREMEALYAKLYDKYTTLKTRKFSELDEINREQEEKFLNFVKASEVLTEHLRSENQNLRNENTEIRSTRDEERLELQKRLLEEELKNKALSYQVEKLKELISEGVPPHNHKDQSGTKRKTPESPQVTTRSMRKRTRQSEDNNMVETDTVSSTTRSSRRRSRLTEDIVVSPHITIPRESTTETILVSQPQCCGSSNSARCPFQALGEHLIGMKLSTNNEGERDCIVATHPSSGLSFTLTWVNNSTGEEEEDELLYKVESLGTFQRVVPEWMRDVIKFSTSMIPVFFERVSRVIKPRD